MSVTVNRYTRHGTCFGNTGPFRQHERNREIGLRKAQCTEEQIRNQQRFTDLDDTGVTGAAWRDDDYAIRLHGAIGNRTPHRFAQRRRQRDMLSA